MNPTKRLLTILRFLGDGRNRGQRVVTSDYIRQKMGVVYAGDSGKRKWRRDIRILSERRLIVTDLPPNRTGISLRAPDKPQPLHLTGREHAAIREARYALRQQISAASPLEDAAGAVRHEIDDVARVLRFLEENGDEVQLAELATLVGVTGDEVLELINHARYEETFTSGIVASLDVGYAEDEDDDETGDPTILTVTVYRRPVDPDSPMRWRGMDELGFFAYSLPETEDRLALIDEALSWDAIAEELGRDLRSACRKLQEWRSELLRREAMS